MTKESFTFNDVRLTLHEMRIIALHCRACKQLQMSIELGNTYNTVHNQISTIYSKLNIHKATELVVWALSVGFTSDGLYKGRDLFK